MEEEVVPAITVENLVILPVTAQPILQEEERVQEEVAEVVEEETATIVVKTGTLLVTALMPTDLLLNLLPVLAF